MKGKELKALITLAGKVDPSLQVAMLKASGQSKKTSKIIQKTFGAANKGLLHMAGKISPAFQSQLQKIEAGASKSFGVLRKGAGYVGKGFHAAGKAAKGLAIGVGAVGVVATAALAPLASQGMQYASDLNEVQNVVDTTFGKSASVIDDFSKTSLKTYGLSTLQAKQYSSVLGSMYKSMGLSSQQTLTMSQNMAALSGDMASFYNLDPEEAFEKIRSGVSGETEPLKQLGINMSETNLQAFAMSQGIKKSYKSMSQAEQATLRYNYLLNATKDAQGDFAKTSDSFANQQRLLKANLQQVAGMVMSKMLPAFASGMQKINSFVLSLDTDAVGSFAGQIANMGVSFLPLVGQLLPLFGSLLQMIFPPLLTLGQQIMPIVILVVQTLMSVLQPLIPPIMQFVQVLLPPLMQILTALSPLLVQIAGIIGSVIGPALSIVINFITQIANLISSVAKPVGDFFNSVGSFLGISGQAKQEIASVGSAASTAKVPAYANGGFANRPSVFGEAGLEAAIPIKPGNARSMGLLVKTAQLLGMKDRYQEGEPNGKEGGGFFRNNRPAGGNDRKMLVKFVYAPVFQGGDRPTENVLKRDAQNIKRVLDDYFGDKGRLAWD